MAQLRRMGGKGDRKGGDGDRKGGDGDRKDGAPKGSPPTGGPRPSGIPPTKPAREFDFELFERALKEGKGKGGDGKSKGGDGKGKGGDGDRKGGDGDRKDGAPKGSPPTGGPRPSGIPPTKPAREFDFELFERALKEGKGKGGDGKSKGGDGKGKGGDGDRKGGDGDRKDGAPKGSPPTGGPRPSGIPPTKPAREFDFELFERGFEAGKSGKGKGGDGKGKGGDRPTVTEGPASARGLGASTPTGGPPADKKEGGDVHRLLGLCKLFGEIAAGKVGHINHYMLMLFLQKSLHTIVK